MKLLIVHLQCGVHSDDPLFNKYNGNLQNDIIASPGNKN